MFKNYSLNIIPTLILIVFFSSPLFTFFVDFSWLYFILLIVNFIWFGLSSSLYYHRTLSHKAAELHPLIHLLFLLGGTISLSGSPIDWVVIHRYHHSNSDNENDPHSPIHGRLWSYIGWIILRDRSLVIELKKKYCSDLIKNKLIVFFDKRFMLIGPTLVYNFLLYIIFGWGGVVYGFLLAGLMSYNFHWMLIASFCHNSKFGYRRYNTLDKSFNVPWLSPFSFGESLHNNHHKYPFAFNLKSKPREFDFSFFVIKILEKLKLAKNINIADYKNSNK